MNNSSADLSAFNGVGKNNALQTQEEEEATEDIRRRQEEVGYVHSFKFRHLNKHFAVTSID